MIVRRLALLNSTVAQLSEAVSNVLTRVYRAIYGDDDAEKEPAVLSLRTSPLAASDEVIALYAANLVPCGHAVSAAMHALGASASAIDNAVEELCQKEEQDKSVTAEQRAQSNEQASLQAETQRAQIAQTKAQTQALKSQAAAKPSSSSGGSSGSSSGGSA